MIEHDVGHRVALDLDDDPHAVAVRLVAKLRDPFDALLAHEFGDLFDQRRLVDLVGDLGDDKGFAVAPRGFDLDLGPQGNRAPTRVVGQTDARPPEDGAAGRKIRAGHDFRQFVDGNLGPIHQGDNGVDHLAEVVGRDVGRHAHRDAARAVDQQVGKARRQDDGLTLLAVVIGLEVDGVLVDVLDHGERWGRQAGFGVAHRRRRIAVDRAEIALPVDERQAQRERLHHADHGVVDRAVAVGMVFAHHVADDAGRFDVGPVRKMVVLLHRVQDAAMHRLQAVAHVRQGPAHDHAHGVIEVGPLHLVGDRNRSDPGCVVRSILVVSQKLRVLNILSRHFRPDHRRRPRGTVGGGAERPLVATFHPLVKTGYRHRSSRTCGHLRRLHCPRPTSADPSARTGRSWRCRPDARTSRPPRARPRRRGCP